MNPSLSAFEPLEIEYEADGWFPKLFSGNETKDDKRKHHATTCAIITGGSDPVGASSFRAGTF